MEARTKIGVAVLGGTGFGAGELLRLLTGHPETTIVSVVSRSEAGVPIASTHKALQSFYDLNFDSKLELDELLEFEHPVIFSALPHAVGIAQIKELVEKLKDSNTKIIDLSGDLRLKDHSAHEAFYPESNLEPELRSLFAYGLTEKHRKELKKAKYVANPGCYPTACSLSVLPLVDETFEGSIHFDAKSGTSGGGKGLGEFFHHPNVGSSITPYKALVHRHEPEIRQALGDPLAERIQTMFVPQLLPVTRGILVTSYLELNSAIETAELLEMYQEFYKDSPFVRVRKEPPSLKHVVGSNFCDISVVARGNQVVAMAAEDNLIKGMAGQAIQNMNLMCGLSETTGLWTPPLGLV